MTRPPKPLFAAIFVSVLCSLLCCTGLPFLVPNPPASRSKHTAAAAGKKQEPRQQQPGEKAPVAVPEEEKPPVKNQEEPAEQDQVDFAAAFGESPGPAAPRRVTPRTVGPAKSVVLPGNKIRVCLRQNAADLVLYALEPVALRSASLDKEIVCRGRIAVTPLENGRISVTISEGPATETALPCTLASSGSSNLIDYSQENFRGSMIISGGARLTLINYIDIEEYLRGVVPMEMGKRPAQEIEALKAQAIAARTYGAKSMLEHSADQFDVFKTIADQVYGGADAETPESDNAVSRTAGVVLTFGDSLISAYYHSTCGGRTANCNEVWDKPGREYLSSVDDAGPGGRAYCAASPFFEWEESWTADQLSKILWTSYGQAYPSGRFEGRLQALDIDKRFDCGRVKHCVLWGSAGRAECGGDRVRFVLRRKKASGEILRSADFTVEKNGPDKFTVRGRGCGHGVGMCQMGAIGRAQAGQTCEQILKAYFKGAELGKLAY